jgi:hypothetical protein
MKSANSLRRAIEPPAFELVEEAVHLLRRAPAGAFALYYAATVPFILALLFFWAHTTWFHPLEDEVAWNALGLAVLFVIAKTAHALFCAELLALRLGTERPAWSWGRFGRIARAQLRVQPWVLLLSFPAMVLTVPFGWLFAYGQSASVIGESERLHDDCVQQARLWPGQNHLGLLLISALACCLWLNIAMLFYLVPWLANHLLGVENMFNLSGWRMFNTTFLASVTALTWLAIDPLVKAFYTLRVFHGRSRRTGDDLRVELFNARRRSVTRAAAVLALFWLVIAPLPRSRAAEAAVSPPAAQPVLQPAELNRAIDDVLAGADFRWQLRPIVASVPEAKAGPISRFLQRGVDMLREGWLSARQTARRILRWLEKLFFSNPSSETSKSGAMSGLAVLRLFLYLFIGLAIVLILWVIFVIWKSAVRTPMPLLTARVAAAAPDLRDENLQAAQLPLDGWLALAREQAARGEWRLAWRALYLATLTRLAADGLLSLAKFKTNLDYERELRRRALSRTEVVTHFARRRRAFEDVWYGRAEPVQDEVQAWLTELERPAGS